MKHITSMKTAFILCLSLGLTSLSHAQQVKEKEIIGTWKLIIDIEEGMTKEAEESDTMLGEIFIKTISKFVGGVLEDVDIYFDFQRNNQLKITVNAYKETETESAKWFINKKGYLEIESIAEDNDHINIETDDEWKMIDGILVNDEHETDSKVYMVKVG